MEIPLERRNVLSNMKDCSGQIGLVTAKESGIAILHLVLFVGLTQFFRIYLACYICLFFVFQKYYLALKIM